MTQPLLQWPLPLMSPSWKYTSGASFLTSPTCAPAAVAHPKNAAAHPALCKRLMELPSCSARPPMIVALDSAARLFHDARPVMRVAAVCLPALLVSPVHAQLPDAGTLTVEVRSEGRPLAGATVSAAGQQGTTDTAGRALLLLAAGPYEVRVEAAGYLPASVPVAIVAEAPPQGSVELRP